MAEKEIGVVTNYYSRIGVAAIQLLDGPLKCGDRIRIRGHTTDFEQVVESMQIDRKNVTEAEAGQHIGVKISELAHEHDRVFQLVD